MFFRRNCHCLSEYRCDACRPWSQFNRIGVIRHDLFDQVLGIHDSQLAEDKLELFIQRAVDLVGNVLRQIPQLALERRGQLFDQILKLAFEVFGQVRRITQDFGYDRCPVLARLRHGRIPERLVFILELLFIGHFRFQPLRHLLSQLRILLRNDREHDLLILGG